jgi:hypothetical protein
MYLQFTFKYTSFVMIAILCPQLHTYIHTYIHNRNLSHLDNNDLHHVTPRGKVFLDKLTVRSASQESPRPLFNPKVHHRVHKSQPPVPILSQMNSVHILLPYFHKIHFNIILPYADCLGFPSCLVLQAFQPPPHSVSTQYVRGQFCVKLRGSF